MKEVSCLSFTQFMIGTILTSLLVVYFPGFNLVTILLWGASVLVSGLYLDRARVLVLFTGNFIIMYMLIPDVAYISFSLISIGLPVLMMSLFLAGGQDYYRIRSAGMMAALLGVTFMLGMIYYHSTAAGVSVFEQLSAYIHGSMEEYMKAGYFDRYLERGVSQEELTRMANIAGGLIVTYFPALKYIQAIVSIFIILALASGFAQHKKLVQLNKKPYPMEWMPWQLSWIVITGLAIWLLDYQGTGYVGSNAVAVMAVICLYYGNAIFVYYYYMTPAVKRKWALILFLMAVWFVPQIVLLFMAVLGLFDSLVDFRKLTKEDKKTL